MTIDPAGRERKRKIFYLWREHIRHNAFGTMAGIAAVILGTLGTLLGDGVSQGMTISLRDAAGPVAHLWGATFAIGGAMKLIGLYLNRSTVEVPGLWVMAGGYAFYSITVVAGLRMHGLAAGVISAALAVGCMLKAKVIMQRARDALRRYENGSNSGVAE